MNELRQELLAAFAVEHREHLGAIRAALAAAERGEAFDLRDVFRRAHSLKGAARAVDLLAVEERAHRLEALFTRIVEGVQALEPATLAAIRAELDGIEDEAAAADAPRRSEPAEPAAAPAATAVEYLRVPSSQIDSLAMASQAVSEALAQQVRIGEALQALETAGRGLRRRWREVAAGQGDAARGFAAELDAMSRGIARLGREQRGASWTAEAAAARLRQDIGRITLVPAEAVLGSLAPMARELVREAGSVATVRLEGLETQADRAVLQALKDPVTHLLRNAVSHGLLAPALRVARGWPGEGQITLRIATRGGLLLVSVIDDGPGPDLARIEAVAVERGLLPPRAPGQPAPPADRLLALVFEPGFSTAAAVDRIAGRGIGLSVVAEAAQRLRGSVVLRQRRPHGAEIEMAVPLSAARQPVLLVEAGGQVYGLPSRAVERLLRLPLLGLDSVEGRPVLRIESEGRDVIVPVVTLASLLGHPAAPAGNPLQAVLLRSAERRCALVVDRLMDVRVLNVEAAEAPLASAELVAGIALRDGHAPAPVLSPEGLVGRWLRDEGRLAAAGLGLAPTPRTDHAATILVVDDSITTRTLEKSILEAQGFHVLLSVDGLDALNRLRGDGALVDLVIADVEMPRMDGFALLQALKNDSRLASIPVILMTSRANPEDVRRGLELGAGAYITKQKFDQRELLATIGQML